MDPLIQATVKDPVGLATLAILGGQLVVFIGQLVVFRRQLSVMRDQKTVAQGQRELLQTQLDWRRDEAIGLFYQLAFGLRDEVREADDMPNKPFNFHPGSFRTALDGAPHTFAPLGNSAIMALAAARKTIADLETTTRDWQLAGGAP